MGSLEGVSPEVIIRSEGKLFEHELISLILEESLVVEFVVKELNERFASLEQIVEVGGVVLGSRLEVLELSARFEDNGSELGRDSWVIFGLLESDRAHLDWGLRVGFSGDLLDGGNQLLLSDGRFEVLNVNVLIIQFLLSLISELGEGLAVDDEFEWVGGIILDDSLGSFSIGVAFEADETDWLFKVGVDLDVDADDVEILVIFLDLFCDFVGLLFEGLIILKEFI